MKYCTHCGAPIPDSSSFCESCGLPCEPAQQNTKRRKNGLGIAGFVVSIPAVLYGLLPSAFSWIIIAVAFGLSLAGLITGLVKKKNIVLCSIGLGLCLVAAAFAIFVAPTVFGSAYEQFIPDLGGNMHV